MSLELRVRRPLVAIDISRSALDDIRDFGHAWQRCAEACGSRDKAVVADVALVREAHLDAPTWTRIKQDAATPSWPTQEAIMDACGNDLPLFWAIHRRGFDPRSLHRYETDIESENRELKLQLAKALDERDVIARFLRDAGRIA